MNSLTHMSFEVLVALFAIIVTIGSFCIALELTLQRRRLIKLERVVSEALRLLGEIEFETEDFISQRNRSVLSE